MLQEMSADTLRQLMGFMQETLYGLNPSDSAVRRLLDSQERLAEFTALLTQQFPPEDRLPIHGMSDGGDLEG